MAKNGKHLVIVESPAKAKTINKYLGDDYIVRASVGHVRDLPRKGMGVNLETFEPEYEIIDGKGKVVSELKKLARDADEIYLATDLDREGEAIAWHVAEALGLKPGRTKRVIFNAITEVEIKKAFENPGVINIDRVNAQQARRILDRVVGFEISPLLWRKVARGLSAGRVQSVAVRLVVDREREIEAFIPDEYWTVAGIFSPTQQPALAAALAEYLKPDEQGNAPTKKAQQEWLGEHDAFEAALVEYAGKKFDEADESLARQVVEGLGYVVDRVDVTEDPEGKGPATTHKKFVGRVGSPADFKIDSIEKKRTTSRPGAPFITSTLQQAGANRLGFAAQRTMRTAQTLYENGHITYMRTDSTVLSGDAIKMARGYIKASFGDAYLPDKPNVYSSSNKAAQEAHEAIRPTDAIASPEKLRKSLKDDEFKLYDLIWRRFVSCQMTPAQFDQTALNIVAATPGGKAVFRATGRKLVFDGFMRVSGVTSDDQLLPDVAEGSTVFPVDLQPSQHFTSPPPRFTEASLIKDLESKGIGRPSTYASIISTIQDREYVLQQNRRFFATLLGKVVTDKLIQGFPNIMEVGFTAGMETQLDDIEDHKVDWVKMLRDFYGPFHADVGKALETLEHAGGMASPYVDEKTGAKLVYRISKNGFFLAAEDREINVTQNVDAFGKPVLREETDWNCPICGRGMIKRKGRFGDFLGCTGYSEKDEAGNPSCQMIVPLDKAGQPMPPKVEPITTDVPCDKCQSPMLLRDSKRGPFLGCSSFPKCRSTKFFKSLEPDQLKELRPQLPELKRRVMHSRELAAKMTDKPIEAFGKEPNYEHLMTDAPPKKKTAKKSAKKSAKKPAKESA